MRIIGGDMGGRKFNPPSNMPYTRPTTDIAKEGLFNILQHRIDFTSLKTLDLFGGTGSISYELASRGAPDLSIVEKDATMVAFIKKTAAALHFENIRIIRADVFKFIAACTEHYDFIFAGPPYALVQIDELPRQIFEKRLLHKNGLFVLEHTPRNVYTSYPFFTMERNYGSTVFSIFTENREP